MNGPKKWRRTVAEVRINIRSRADNSGFNSAASRLGDLRDQFEAANSSASSLTRTTSTFTKILGRTGIVGGTALAGAIKNLDFLKSAALGAAAGLVGIGTAAVGAFATVTLGMDGIRKAAEKAKPAFDRLKAAVSSVFEAELSPAFERLGKLADEFTPQFKGIAQSLSNMFTEVVVGGLERNRPKIDKILTGISDMFTNMTPGASKLFDGIVDFVSKIDFAQLGTDIGKLLDKAGQFLKDLDAEDIKQGWEDFKTTLQTVQAVFAGIQATLGVIGGLIDIVTMDFTSFMQRIGLGPEEIKTLWTDLGAWFSTTVFAPIAAAGVSAFNSILSTATSVWSSILSFVGGVIAGIVGFIVTIPGELAGAWNSLIGIVAGIWNSIVSAVAAAIARIAALIASISWPSPPAWLSGMFAFDPFAGLSGERAFMSPTVSVQLAQGFPSVADLGGIARGGMVTNIDNSVTVKVDGSGVVDPQRVSHAVIGALGRNTQTRGLGYAVNLGAA